MQKFKPKDYTILDFINWNENEQLSLNPDFQRRDVWPLKAKTYLIDTILSGKPIPKLFVREIIDKEKKHTIRDVIDGQQRLRSILGFYNNEYKIKVENEDFSFSGFFKDLPEDLENNFLEYDLSTDVVQNMTHEDIIDVFSRLNTFSYALNKQELFNSQYFGEFKTLVHNTSIAYHNFWVTHGIFSLRRISRMADTELMSDIIAAIIKGPVARGDIEKVYKEFDDKIPSKARLLKNIHKTFSIIDNELGSFLKGSNFTRPQLFYGLFLATYHNFCDSLDFLGTKYQYEADLNQFRSEIETLEYDLIQDNFTTAKEEKFKRAISVQTTNKSHRTIVITFILDRILR